MCVCVCERGKKIEGEEVGRKHKVGYNSAGDVG